MKKITLLAFMLVLTFNVSVFADTEVPTSGINLSVTSTNGVVSQFVVVISQIVSATTGTNP